MIQLSHEEIEELLHFLTEVGERPVSEEELAELGELDIDDPDLDDEELFRELALAIADGRPDTTTLADHEYWGDDYGL